MAATDRMGEGKLKEAHGNAEMSGWWYPRGAVSVGIAGEGQGGYNPQVSGRHGQVGLNEAE